MGGAPRCWSETGRKKAHRRREWTAWSSRTPTTRLLVDGSITVRLGAFSLILVPRLATGRRLKSCSRTSANYRWAGHRSILSRGADFCRRRLRETTRPDVRNALTHSVPPAPIWMIGDNVDADCLPAIFVGAKPILVRTAAAFERRADDLWAALELIQRG